MNPILTRIQEQLLNSQLIETEKQALLKLLADADKQWTITDFKLDRTEKVKKTTAILLEETIEELEKKRQAVEAQNRELEIEKALEKVRAVAMGMNKPEDLVDICEILFNEFRSLGFDVLRNAMINIHDDEHSSFVNYDYSDEIGKSITPLVYDIHPVIEKQIREIRTADDAFSETVFAGKDLEEWKKFRRERGEKDDPRIDDVVGLHYYFYSIGSGSLGISTFAPIDGEKLALLKRFRNVFILAYQRYTDIAQAAAQAREAMIEAALERVRSRTMAMHKTEELLPAAELVAKELSALGVNSMNVSYAFVEKGENSASYYSVNPVDGKVLPFPFVFPQTHTDVMRSILSSWKKQEPFNVLELDEEATTRHQTWVGEHIQKLMIENGIPFSVEEFLNISPRTAVIYSFNFAQGYFFNIGEDRLTTAQEEMVLRFTKVFEMTYRRFLDLQKAEAQAREGQIEAALERVRSRSMAMYKSSELGDVAVVLFQQLRQLGGNLWATGVGLCKEDRDVDEFWMATEGGMQEVMVIPHTEDSVHRAMFEGWKNGDDIISIAKEGEELKTHYDYMLTLPSVGPLFEAMVASGFDLPTWQTWHAAYFSYGYLLIITLEPYDEKYIFKRFAKVFEQAYTRFLDLQKAEAQAKEAQIEAALEKVRSRSMAMQKSEELKEVIQVVFEQFGHLQINIGHTGFVIDYKARDDYEIWVADPLGVPAKVTIPYFDSVYYNRFNEAKEKDEDFFTTLLDFEEKNRFYQKLFEYIPELPEESKAFYFSCPGLAASTVLLENIGLYIENFSGIPYSEEDNATLMRFGKVFQQTYTRFLDLQNAEEQARESQIQLAMERVRARTMAMQHSDELPEAAQLLFQQVESLGIPAWSTGYCIWEEDKKAVKAWMSSKGVLLPSFRAPLTEEATFIHMREAWERGESFFVDEISGEAIKTHYEYMATVPSMDKIFKPVLESGFQLPTFQINHIAYYSQGFLSFITYERVPQAHDIFKRFAKVFEQTYTRFLDLQKAEAQAREAKIEAALEKVRSRTMAMQRSSELADVATVLFQQVKALGIPQWSCGFNIWEIGDREFTFYPGSPDGDILPPCRVPLTEDPVFILFDESRRRGDELCIYESAGEMQKEHYRYMLALPGGLGDFLQSLLDMGVTFPDFQIDHIANFSRGNLLFITYEHFPEMHDVFKRFANVFDQTYTRFLDLQKAEAQAREAQIEAALEKIRSRTMAMQRSDELGDTALLLFQQVQALGGKLFGCGFVIWDEGKATSTAWMAGEDRIQPPFKISNTDDVFLKVFEAEKRGEPIYMEVMAGEHIKTHYRYMLGIPEFQKIVDQFKMTIPEFQIFHCAFFSYGYLSFISLEPVPELHDLFKRFAKVFDQTYTRFIDLQKAEALTKEAIKQASLDRIRGQVASMRSANDLELIIPMLWRELRALNMPFIRCGVFIMNEADSIVNVFLSSPDGKSLGLLHLPFDTGGVTQNAVEHWRKKKVYKEHWNREEFMAWTQTLIAAGQVHDASSYQGAAAPPESLYLHFVPFKQGMLYVGSAEALDAGNIEVMKTLASTFSIAYSRYEDFRLLEEAKNRIETTLVELKATQSQLVQSEKMASLGELTAGIAHEIQNPLNFVNNFSELSNELIEEMEQEMAKGNKEEVDSIIGDLRSNLEKINQHGRRADSIVKGMLQHSRVSTGEKEPTDINALADEYLRLAYHGYRAKDKSFNAILETDLDPSIGKIKAVPQELGRVLLNLYNNAFYAVNEKAGTLGYDPKVRLSTTRHGNTILIAVQDNGKGMPEKVKEKIFQPFFTTKPTGQGTGLGLSLSYDIVKAHSGEFRVESTEGEGTSFIIQLPV
jgi:signal transduction histidine kinase